MATMNMRQLRNTRQLKSLLRAGKTVELQDRNRPIARIIPIDKPAAEKQWPDFEARLHTIFGDRVLNVVNEFVEDRSRW